MKTDSKDPGSASAEELAKYWRLPPAKAARELARKVGIRHVGGRYPWHAIWQAEGLAPPPRSRWDELKLPHCTADDVASWESRRVPPSDAAWRSPTRVFLTRSRFGKSRRSGEGHS